MLKWMRCKRVRNVRKEVVQGMEGEITTRTYVKTKALMTIIEGLTGRLSFFHTSVICGRYLALNSLERTCRSIASIYSRVELTHALMYPSLIIPRSSLQVSHLRH